ncbi:beta-ketoacyl-[acyl-carrier-protein] synthase family protein [Salidesulfovibrio onnuriiensis]|uniref:beta-ketoacyl-[acyl-carrier-protein] synthase family protein n=1 Tax=Salidesulfovibrio onnuriiensis TaxID=2583823 RepID=UPI00202B2713|nr:beta-ketoacyl-[acyl-carrier-protein] synthase family protein [Salidesulfovibrio onnuriiensis]
MMPVSPVAVVGADCICASGHTLDACMEAMLRGGHGPAMPTLFQCAQPEQYPVFEVRDFEPRNGDADFSRTCQLLFHATEQALRGADITPDLLEGLTVGVCIGTSVGASLNFMDYYEKYRNNEKPGLAPIHTYLRSNPATALARRWKFSGPVQSVVNACSSGTDAIGMGASWIRQGLCDLVVAGGADELNEISYNGFARLMITSTGQCRPFDRERSGLNLGEGAGVLLLASDKAASLLRATPRARLLGYGTCSDAHHLTAPHPEARGLEIAVEQALQCSGLAPEDIGFINVHGTATRNNDPVEGHLLAKYFSHAPFVSTKGYTGHTLGAAGGIEAALTIACLERETTPGCRGFAQIDPEIGLAPVRENTSLSARHALSQSLAFGGNNSAIIFEKGQA